MATKEGRNLETLNQQAFKQKFDLEGSGYDAIENIGSGAYGIVCSAIHKKTQERVAIKKISHAFDHIEIWKSTYREIRILRHFKHENIIAIREILKPKKDNIRDIQIVLDFMESDLHKIIHTQELSDEHIRFFLYQILRGLKYIHSANVIHRDLKPSNLLVNANCELKIGDFGMARVVATSSRDKHYNMTQYVATRWYRAPELIIPYGEYTFSVDLWSVGCILAEMIVQKVLFKGENPYQQFSLIVGKCGTPSKECLEKFAVPFMQVLSKTHHKPVDWSKEFPKAHKKAIDMLGKLLRIDPRDRITADVALKHPYLSKYHEPPEPVCIPALDVDFEEKISATDQLRKLITEEIMSYHRPSNFGIPNLKPVPVEQVKLLTNKKHQALLSENAVPQLSPRTTGLASFLQLQKTIKNTKCDISTFKKPFPAVIANNASDDAEIPPTCKSANKENAQKVDLQESEPMLSGASSCNDDSRSVILPDKYTGDHDVPAEQQQRQSTADEEAGDRPQSPIVAVTSESAPQSKTLSSLAMKLKIKEAILKGQTKQRPVIVDNRPKPVTAYQRRKEKEIKREKMKSRRKTRLKEQKSDGEMSQDDLSMLARWEQMQKDPKEKSGNDPLSSEKKAALPAAGLKVPGSKEDNTGCIAMSSKNESSGPKGLQTSNSGNISIQSGSAPGSAIITNIGGPVFATGVNITQNVFIPLSATVPYIQAIPSTPVVYTPEMTRIPEASTTVPLKGANQALTYTQDKPTTPVVVVGEGSAPFSQTMYQAGAAPVPMSSALTPSLVTQQPKVVSSQSLPFTTYQTLSQPVIFGSATPVATHVVNNANTLTSSDDTVAELPLPSPICHTTEPAPSDSNKSPQEISNNQDMKGQGTRSRPITAKGLDSNSGQTHAAEIQDAPLNLHISQQLRDVSHTLRLQPSDKYQGSSVQDQGDSETPPVIVPFSSHESLSLSSVSDRKRHPEPLDLKQDVKKAKVNTDILQPTLIVLSPKGKLGSCAVSVKVDAQLGSANSDMNSGTTESAPASGLKRDWQQAIDMDPKELEEALRTVMQTELPSPRFVSDLMDPK